MPRGVYKRSEEQIKSLIELSRQPRTLRGGGYQAIHKWLKKNFGKADKCENPNCIGKSKNFHYALLKGKKHKHKRENYIMLCVSCHRLYDLKLDWIKRMRATKTGVKMSKKHKENISIACQGINKGNQHPAVKVCQLNKNNNLIKVFDSILKASQELKISPSGICMCCRGQLKTCGGFIWIYNNKSVR